MRYNTSQPTQRPPGIFRARKYGDPVMVDLMGLDTVYLGTSNFQNVALFTEQGGFGAVSQFQRLNRAALDYLIAIQPQDAATLNQKMAFLCGLHVSGRPYWTRGAEWDGAWSSFEFGTIVFGGQLVQVEVDAAGVPLEYYFFAKYQQMPVREWITFYKLVGMRWSERNTVSHATHPWLIERCTWATYNTATPNEYKDTWYGGVIYHPVWSPLDFPSNYGDTLYIAKAFLETP